MRSSPLCVRTVKGGAPATPLYTVRKRLGRRRSLPTSKTTFWMTTGSTAVTVSAHSPAATSESWPTVTTQWWAPASSRLTAGGITNSSASCLYAVLSRARFPR